MLRLIEITLACQTLMLPASLLKARELSLKFSHMATRSYLANWEYLLEPIEYELRQLSGVGFAIAAQTVMYHQRISSGREIQRHEKTLLEELTKLRDPLQRATEYVNQMMHELEPHASKRRRATENPAGSQSSWAADGHQISVEGDEWKGAGKLFSKVDHLCRYDSVSIPC